MNLNIKKISAVLLLSSASTASWAAGYAIMEQSVTGLGRAFSGSAAVAEDATTIFFNPAGLTQLDKSELDVGIHYLSPQSEFDDTGSTLPAALGGGPIPGSEESDAAKNVFVPNIYYAHPVNDKTVLGLGINAPFGLITDYNDDWKGRYHALESNLRTININPSVAFKATEKFSVGLGLNLQYIDLRLSKAIDFGSACASFMVGSCASPANPELDGKVKLDADDWSWGYNLGLTYQVTEATRLGLSYRSKISHHLKGEGKFRVPDRADVEAVASGAGLEDGDIDGKVTLPESASVAIHHQLNDEWAIMADVTWTRWSRFKELAINSDDVFTLNSTKQEDWENARRYGLGVSYTPADAWSYRAGVAFDESPVPGSHRRTPRIADNDRTWLAFGASYQATDNIIIDAAYAHLFVKESKINDDANGYSLIGEYEGSVDIVSVQMRWLID